MDYNELMQHHCYATLCTNTVNSNGTTWLCSNGGVCNDGTDYRVLVDGRCRTKRTTLGDLFDEYDVLEVQVDGYTVY